MTKLDEIYTHPQIIAIATAVAAVYDVDACLISLMDGEEQISTVASYKLQSGGKCEMGSLQGSRLCKMTVKRGAPMILDNAEESHFQDDPLVAMSPSDAAENGVPISGIRFFAERCLQMPSGEWCGTMCLADRNPRSNFTLKDAATLDLKSFELITTLQDLGYAAPLRQQSNRPP
jgi:hypothetical protein